MRIYLLDLSIPFSLRVFALQLLQFVPCISRNVNSIYMLKPKSPIGDYFRELKILKLKLGSVEVKIASPAVINPNSFNSLFAPFRSG